MRGKDSHFIPETFSNRRFMQLRPRDCSAMLRGFPTWSSRMAEIALDIDTRFDARGLGDSACRCRWKTIDSPIPTARVFARI
jgi:hypothetical protein